MPALFSCSNNSALSMNIAANLGIDLIEAPTRKFQDGEIDLDFAPASVHGVDVILLQSLFPSVNDALVELLITAHALVSAGARILTAVLPYVAYARQDKLRNAGPIGCLSNLLSCAGVESIVTLDLHSYMAANSFGINLTNLSAMEEFAKIFTAQDGICIVAPDNGSVQRAGVVSKFLGAPMICIDKNKKSFAFDASYKESITEKKCIIVDDITTTGSTIINAASILGSCSPQSIVACITHAVCDNICFERIHTAGVAEIYTTDSISHPNTPNFVKQISIAGIIAKQISAFLP